MTKEKALYQVKVILDYLPRDEYELISHKTIEYIDENYEFDERFQLDPNIPLHKQNISEKAYDVLKKIVKEIESNTISRSDTKADNMNRGDDVNELQIAKNEKIRLDELVEALKVETNKVEQAKQLTTEYRQVLIDKDAEVSELKEQISSLQKDNENLIYMLNKLPVFLKKLFLGKEYKLLK